MEMRERIVRLRKKRGLSAAELARQVAIAQSTLHGYEHGTREAKGMSVEIAIRLAHALGVSVEYLCGVYDDEWKPALV